MFRERCLSSNPGDRFDIYPGTRGRNENWGKFCSLPGLGITFGEISCHKTWKHMKSLESHMTVISESDSDLQWSCYTCTFILTNMPHFRVLADFYLKWHVLLGQHVHVIVLFLTSHITHFTCLNIKTPPSTLPAPCNWCSHIFGEKLETLRKNLKH